MGTPHGGRALMAQFWFELRGTERYHMTGQKRIEIPARPKNRKTFKGDTSPGETLPATFRMMDDWYAPKEPATASMYEAYQIDRNLRPVYRNADNTQLQEVDRLICQFMGEPEPDDRIDSKYYMMCHQLGFYSLFNLGGSYVDLIHVRWMKERKRLTFVSEAETGISDVEYARRCALFDWVFTQKWRFGANG